MSESGAATLQASSGHTYSALRAAELSCQVESNVHCADAAQQINRWTIGSGMFTCPWFVDLYL